MISCKRLSAGLALLFLGQFAALASSARPSPNGATVTFRKVFKTSSPEFTEIKVNESGSGTYDIRQLDDEPSPQPFEISASLVRRIFDLTARLHNFNGIDVEIHHRIANLGQKTFRYERGSEVHETTFNYTINESASQLLGIFEGLARQEGDLSDLVRTMRYDRLGVNDVLLHIEVDYNKKLLPEPENLLPSLDQVAADSHFIDIARERARTLAGRIRSGH